MKCHESSGFWTLLTWVHFADWQQGFVVGVGWDWTSSHDRVRSTQLLRIHVRCSSTVDVEINTFDRWHHCCFASEDESPGGLLHVSEIQELLLLWSSTPPWSKHPSILAILAILVPKARCIGICSCALGIHRLWKKLLKSEVRNRDACVCVWLYLWLLLWQWLWLLLSLLLLSQPPQFE